LRGFIFLRVFRLKRQVFWALVLALLFAGALYPYYVSYRERQAIEALSWSVAGKVIVVDPGHGGIDPGCVGRSGVQEKEVNLELARRLAVFLNQAGARVILTREGDYDLSDEKYRAQLNLRQKDDLEARVEIARKYQADLFISIHVNAISLSDCWGAQVFYHPQSREGKRLAGLIQQELIKTVGESYRWIKPEDFFVLRSVGCPAVIVEAGFISHPREETLLQDPVYQNKLAWCVYAGVVRYFSGEPEPREPDY
jgi:N-acetylmuramoyl-L-alanine amidase